MSICQRVFACTSALLLACVAQGAARAQESLASAKDLYAAAAYEEALTVLNRLAPGASGEGRSVAQYRALCLLALGRTSEAERAIEEVVSAEPLYQPSEADASPRVRAAFSDVRRRMLPALAQQKYVVAKATFDRKEYAAAAAQFQTAIELLDDPAAGTSDLRTLAAGFLELSRVAATPPPPVVAPPPAPVAAPPPPPAAVAPAPEPSPIASVGDPGVMPPLAIRQKMPRWSSAAPPPATAGTLELVINEHGGVESAVLSAPLGLAYDAILLAAARTWKYKPATRDGRPVKFHKVIQISAERK